MSKIDHARTIIRTLADAGIRGRIPARRAIEAREMAANYLLPLIPAGTLGWLAHPRKGETVAGYSARVVGTAAARALWAGGLMDGTEVYPDADVVRSVAAIVAREVAA